MSIYCAWKWETIRKHFVPIFTELHETLMVNFFNNTQHLLILQISVNCREISVGSFKLNNNNSNKYNEMTQNTRLFPIDVLSIKLMEQFGLENWFDNNDLVLNELTLQILCCVYVFDGNFFFGAKNKHEISLLAFVFHSTMLLSFSFEIYIGILCLELHWNVSLFVI